MPGAALCRTDAVGRLFFQRIQRSCDAGTGILRCVRSGFFRNQPGNHVQDERPPRPLDGNAARLDYPDRAPDCDPAANLAEAGALILQSKDLPQQSRAPGRNNEATQTGIELLGAPGRRADLEVIVTAVEALSRCVPNFRLELGHAGFFRALAAQLPIGDDLREDIRSTIESKNYAALNTILDQLENSRPVDAMRRLPRLFGGEEVFAQAAPLCSDETSSKTLAYLHELYQALVELGLGDRMIVDLGLVQRNDYYTGVIFSAYVENVGDAVLLGGRYDKLLAQFDTPMPAVGFGVNVDGLAELLLKQGKIPAATPVEVLVHSDEGYEIKALQYASRLAGQGCKCESSVFETREEALHYAKVRGIHRVDCVSDCVETINL